MEKWRRLLGWAALLAGLSWLLAIGVWAYLDHRHTQQFMLTYMTHPIYDNVAALIARQGPGPDLEPALAQLPKHQGITGYFITDDAGQVIAADTPTTGEIPARVTTEEPTIDGRPRFLTVGLADSGAELYATGRTLQGPDGRWYGLFSVHPPLPRYRYYTQLAVPAGILAFGLAWLLMALWMAVDAASRRMGSGPAWGVLGLLTGPVGLVTYLIVRPAPEVCPGCGQTLDPGGPFCPHCGYALKPACPSCRQPVAHTWQYCRSCGTPLTEAELAPGESPATNPG